MFEAQLSRGANVDWQLDILEFLQRVKERDVSGMVEATTVSRRISIMPADPDWTDGYVGAKGDATYFR